MIRTDSDDHSRESRNPTCPKVPPDELDPRLRGDDHDSRLAKGGVCLTACVLSRGSLRARGCWTSPSCGWNSRFQDCAGAFTMGYETIDVKPVTATIGAEIFGVDLGKPLGNQQFQEVHDALMAHQVIFFRDQKLSLEQHKAFGRLLVSCTSIRIRRGLRVIRRFCRSTPMRTRSVSPASDGIPTCRAIRSRRWDRSST